MREGLIVDNLGLRSSYGRKTGGAVFLARASGGCLCRYLVYSSRRCAVLETTAQTSVRVRVVCGWGVHVFVGVTTGGATAYLETVKTFR